MGGAFSSDVLGLINNAKNHLIQNTTSSMNNQGLIGAITNSGLIGAQNPSQRNQGLGGVGAPNPPQRNQFGGQPAYTNTHEVMANQQHQGGFGQGGQREQMPYQQGNQQGNQQGFQGNFGLANRERIGNPWMAGFDQWRNGQRGFGREQLIQNILASMGGRNVQI